ncbi:MAG TPA: C4-dicarboxylate transporter DctA [Vicinamibacterales bacterium]|nr:C4-dicarboxylate transporter DctA [Vicinamibacterales bacterium]
MHARGFFKSIYGQVLVATVIGVVLGHFYPAAGAAMKPLGDAFIKLVRMIVGPIIFCTVVAGIAGAGGLKGLGRTGLVTLIYFEIVTTAALLIGLMVVNVIKPGAGMNVDPASLDTTAITQYVTAGRSQTVTDTLLSIIPSSPVDAFARTDILQVLFFSVLFGVALSAMGDKGRPVTEAIDRLAQVLFRIVGFIMHVAPLGAFGAMAFTIGAFGVRTLAQLGALVASFWLTCLLFVAVVLGVVARLAGFSLWRFIRYIREELFVAFGTSSSETVLPRLMARLEEAGVDRSIVGLVVPAGYSFNLDGTAVYLSMATVFIAQATNTPLGVPEQVGLLAILLLTSKGAAGVAGAALVVLAGTLAATNQIPVAGVALVLGIHRFMGEGMAVTNTIGNGVAALVIAKWSRKLDTGRLKKALDSGL